MKEASEDVHIYQTTFGKGQHKVTENNFKKAQKTMCTCTVNAHENDYSTCTRCKSETNDLRIQNPLPQPEYLETNIYGHCLPPLAYTTCTIMTDEEREPRINQTDWETTHDYSSIPENATSAVQTRVPLLYPIYENVNPQRKDKSMTQAGKEKKSSRINEQNLHLQQMMEATEVSATNITPNKRGMTPCKMPEFDEEPLKDTMDQKQHQRCTDDLTQKDKATRMSASKIKPVPQPRRQTSCKEILKGKQPLKEYMEQRQQQGCTDDITQKSNATEMPATKIKTSPQPRPSLQKSCQEIPESKEPSKKYMEQTKQQGCTDDITQKGNATDEEKLASKIRPVPQPRSCKEMPEIEEHLEEFREQLKQLKQEGCSDITSIVVSNLNFVGRMMDKKGGRLQLKSHGVMLYIPPDALGDEPQEIFIYVQQNLMSSHPTVKDGFVTPIVHCGTSGLKFKNPVILTFPVHVKDSSHRKLTGVRQDSSTRPWAEISDCSSEVVLFHDGLCTVVTDHFTGYGAAKQSNDPPVSGILSLRLGVFISQNGAIDPVHGCMQLRVRIWDESPETSKYIKDAEKDSKVMDTHRRLFLDTTEGPNNDVYVEIQSWNVQWRITDRQVLPLRRFRLDSRVDESCTFNLKPLPHEADNNLLQLECDVRVGQRSDEVVIKAVHEIEIRPVHRRERLNMHATIADDDSNPMPPEITRDLFLFYKERQRKINNGELNSPIQCTGDDQQDQARQLHSSPHQPNHEMGENHGYQVQENDGIEVRNEQIRSQCHNKDKPKNVLKRLTKFMKSPFTKKTQPCAGNESAGFDPYSLPHDFPQLMVDDEPSELTPGYRQITSTPIESFHYMNIPPENRVMTPESKSDEHEHQVEGIL